MSAEIPPMDSRYGSVVAVLVETGEKVMLVTVDGAPIAAEPSNEALRAYAEEMHMTLITRERHRDLLRSEVRWFSLPRWARVWAERRWGR